MRAGVLFTILGIIYMWGGTYEWYGLENDVFTFKEINFIGIITMLFGCLMLTIEKAGDDIIKALKKED